MERIKERIKGLAAENRTIFIGIDGLGGAGKSTVSEKLEKELTETGITAVVLHIDDFIHPRAVRYNDNYEEWECYYNLQWRYDYINESIVKPAKKGSFSDMIELYNKDNDTYILYKLDIPSGSVVIIEGIFLQRPELKGVFDYMIYMDVSEEKRFERVLKRDGYIGNEQQIREKYENRYFPAERRYFSMCCPRENADLVL